MDDDEIDVAHAASVARARTSGQREALRQKQLKEFGLYLDAGNFRQRCINYLLYPAVGYRRKFTHENRNGTAPAVAMAK